MSWIFFPEIHVKGAYWRHDLGILNGKSIHPKEILFISFRKDQVLWPAAMDVSERLVAWQQRWENKLLAQLWFLSMV